MAAGGCWGGKVAAGGCWGGRGQQGQQGSTWRGALGGALGGGHLEGCDLQGEGIGGVGIISYIIDSLVMTNYYFLM